jgi:hypothetical protein
MKVPPSELLVPSYGLDFEVTRGLAPAAPTRADVVCFVGFVRRRSTKLPDELRFWLRDHGWSEGGQLLAIDHPLLDTPVPLESFEAFSHVFEGERPGPRANEPGHTSWLSAAVRAFFTQGGRRCIVVRTGDPAPYRAPSDTMTDTEREAFALDQAARIALLVPHHTPGVAVPTADDRASWRGIGVLHGLPEVAVVCMPDLAEIVADAELPPPGLAQLPPSPEAFAECATPIATVPSIKRAQTSAPACTELGYERWFVAVHAAADFMRRFRRHIHAQLLLSVPLPQPGATPRGKHLKALAPAGQGLEGSLDVPDGIATTSVQLVFPWLRTTTSSELPGGLEPPDGAFAGVLARKVAASGAFRSLGRELLRDVVGFVPVLAAEELQASGPATAEDALVDRVSLLGPSPTGARVLSDRTASLRQDEQPAGIERLTLAILRTAHQLGQELVFEPSGPVLWRSLRAALERLLTQFYELGALRGASARDAFEVRCDATTTTQQDIDGGRVIAQVKFAPAHAISWITVVLTLREGSAALAGAA